MIFLRTQTWQLCGCTLPITPQWTRSMFATFILFLIPPHFSMLEVDIFECGIARTMLVTTVPANFGVRQA